MVIMVCSYAARLILVSSRNWAHWAFRWKPAKEEETGSRKEKGRNAHLILKI